MKLFFSPKEFKFDFLSYLRESEKEGRCCVM